jgi:hypothetical protein
MSKTIRQSPSDSATIHKIGSIMKGNDGQRWVVDKTSNGVHRWTSNLSCKLNDMMILTVDHLNKNINKPIKLYLREYSNLWPKKNEWSKPSPTNSSIIFKPTGNAIIGKKIIPDWLKNQTSFKKGLNVEGYLSFDGKTEVLSSLQVDSKNKKIVSINLMNTEIFVSI